MLYRVVSEALYAAEAILDPDGIYKNKSMSSNLNISLIQDISGFQRLKEEWTCLLDDSESKNVFMTWEWLYTWWRVYGLNNGKLQLNLIELRDENGRLVGIAPLKTRKSMFLKRLELIGDGADVISEYLGFVSRKGYEKEVAESIDKIINKLHGTDIVSLKPLQSQSLESWGSLKWPHGRVLEFSRCPVVDLPKSWSEFLKTQSANFKKKAKEYYRVCRRDLNLRFVLVDSENELNGWVKELERLHNLRWNGESRAFNSDSYKKFHLDIARQFLSNGWLRLFLLFNGEKPIAALYCFAYNGVYYYYQSGRDPAYEKYHVGYVLMNLAIQEAINEGAIEFDMLTGEETYKRRWAKRKNICHHFLAFKNRRAYLCYQFECVLGRLLYLQHHCGHLRKNKLLLNSFLHFKTEFCKYNK